MSEASYEIAHCHSCSAAMDISALRPFTRCICPTCGAEGRVKRDFGHYTLMKRHAEGGMSSVFGAHDNTLDREVAIKVLNATYSSDETRIAAFEHEAKLTASLSHPHIVKVYTTGRAYGCFYIAMEFVSGGHLEQIIRSRGKIPEQEMLELAIEIVEGLRAAHDSGLLHRDIKPGNILLDSQGHAKLVDFGLSLVTQGGKATAEEIWATPYYVPPETIDGMEEDLRSDIYAFGCTLYHALAGTPPCTEATMAADKLKTAKRSIVPISAIEPNLCKETTNIVAKAIAYDAADRFQSYDELLDALGRALSYAKSGRHEPSDRMEQRKALLLRKRQRQRIIAAAAVLLVLVVGMIFLISKGDSEPTPVRDPLAIQDPAHVGTKTNRNAAADLAQNYGKARASIQKGEHKTAENLFSQLLKRPDFQEPSRSMCGVEAILAAYLDGRAADAHLHASELLDHIRKTKKMGNQPISSSLASTIRQLGDYPPLHARNMSGKPTAQNVLASMLAGLKNWEQGMLEDATRNFRTVTSLKLPANDQWAGIYQAKAREYLRDYDLLTSPVFEKYPSSPGDCQQALLKLAELRASLKTKGRAQFNISAWMTDIERHAKLLEIPQRKPTEGEPTPPKDHPLEAVARHIRKFEFSRAANAIKEMSDSPTGIQPQSLVKVCKLSEDFLKDLEADLSLNPIEIEFALANGTKATALAKKSDGTLEARTETGRQPVRWQDLSTDSLNSIHRKFVTGNITQAETLRRHECAIWFDWLTGNRERANRAAEAIGSSNPAFGERWAKLTHDLRNLK